MFLSVDTEFTTISLQALSPSPVALSSCDIIQLLASCLVKGEYCVSSIDVPLSLIQSRQDKKVTVLFFPGTGEDKQYVTCIPSQDHSTIALIMKQRRNHYVNSLSQYILEFKYKNPIEAIFTFN